MRIAAMQPYFLPYLGYFSLIAASDRFVVFDPVQYIRKGWINRNRILRPGRDDFQYINVPVEKHARDTLIRDVRISSNADWKEKLAAQVAHYRNTAPFFDQASLILQQCLDVNTDSIVKLNVHCLQVVCDAVGIPLNAVSFDEIQPVIEAVEHPGAWALEIATRLGASAYINPAGGREIFRPDEFAERDIQLLFLSNSLQEYSQRNRQHIEGLSILDVLMFNSLEDTRRRIVEDITITA